MIRLIIALLVVSSMMSGQLLAQRTGSQYRPSHKKSEKLREISNEYADCVVKKKPEMAREAILSNANNDVISKRYKRLINGTCLVKANDGKGGRMTFGGDHFRYSIAGALVRADLQNHIPKSFKGVPLLARSKPINPNPEMMARTDRKAKKYQEAASSAKSMRALSIYGECVVRSDPENSFALTMSEIGSDQETAAFQKLQPSFGPCLNGEGDYRFSRSILRGLINVNYYRLAMAARKLPVEISDAAKSEAQN